ncbi:MAG: tRNA-dihydrouridine synthase, partial [Myxococcota bacterium]
AAAWDGRAVPDPPRSGRAEFIVRHLAAHLEHHGDDLRGLKKFRQHLIWYSRGMRGGAAFREHVMQLEVRREVERSIRDFFSGSVEVDLGEAPLYDERAALG